MKLILVNLRTDINRVRLYKYSICLKYQTGMEINMAVKLYREYRIKFYLNMRHYIIIDGKKGEIHPHTREFALILSLEEAHLLSLIYLRRELPILKSTRIRCLMMKSLLTA